MNAGTVPPSRQTSGQAAHLDTFRRRRLARLDPQARGLLVQAEVVLMTRTNPDRFASRTRGGLSARGHRFSSLPSPLARPLGEVAVSSQLSATKKALP